MSQDALDYTSAAIVPADAVRADTSADRDGAEARLAELGRTLLDFKLTADQRVDALEVKLRQTQRQVWLLKTGLALTLLGVGCGLVAGLTWVRTQQVKLIDQVEAIAIYNGPDGEVVSQLNQLDEQVNALQQQVPDDLPNRLEGTEEQLSAIEQTVADLSADQDQRREVISVLTEALQSIVADAPAAGELSQNDVDTPPAENAAEADAGE